MKKELDYPYGKQWFPEIGKPFEVLKGVYWLRMPLPMSLDHINLWLLKDSDQWIIVDTGLDSKESREAWERVFDEFMEPASIKYIVVTHYHPDHIGMAAWLHQRCKKPVHISRGEFSWYRRIIDRDASDFEQTFRRFAREVGLTEKAVETYLPMFAVENKAPGERLEKQMVSFMSEGDFFTIGGKEWSIVGGNGHSPEHCCLYCPELKVMISGDQLLPRISSNISVTTMNEFDDPLADWLQSCDKLKQLIPNETLILPAHQEPFYGAKVRAEQLIDMHKQQLQLLRDSTKQELDTIDATRILFNRELNAFERFMAISETLSHLNYLITQGDLHRNKHPEKRTKYLKTAPQIV